MRILITGVTGFLGSRLAAALCASEEVCGIVRQPLNTAYLRPPLRDKLTLLPYDGSTESLRKALEQSRPELVFHLAAHYTGAHTPDAVRALTESNLWFGCSLLEAISAAGCRRLVYATTSMTHRTGQEYRPLNLYAATKQAFADLVAFYTDAGLIHAAGVMLSDTYGPGDCRPKVLNLIRQAILENQPMALTSGRQVFDLLHVNDIVSGLHCAAAATENPAAPHQLFQLRSHAPLSLRETVDLMCRVNHLTFRANWGGKPEPERQICRQVAVYPPPPGWAQRIPLEEGLQDFWKKREAAAK